MFNNYCKCQNNDYDFNSNRYNDQFDSFSTENYNSRFNDNFDNVKTIYQLDWLTNDIK